MIPTLTRRSFVATAALTAASLGLPRGAWAATHKPLLLTATSRTLDIDGRAATVWGLVNAEGGIGLTLDPGQSRPGSVAGQTAGIRGPAGAMRCASGKSLGFARKGWCDIIPQMAKQRTDDLVQVRRSLRLFRDLWFRQDHSTCRRA